MRFRRRYIAATLLLPAALLLGMFWSASRDPEVRAFHYTPDGWAAGSEPRRLVLLTDAHISGPDGPPARLRRIVREINGLQPDLVLLGGDFLSAEKLLARRYPVDEALAPLRALRARDGVVAVLGNHDHWSDPTAVREALARAGVTVLDNSAVRRGAIVIGGVDDAHTGHDDVPATVSAMDRLGGTPILLSHSPDVFPRTPRRVGLVLAGHTHCGQVAAPFIGPLVTMSRYGRRYACGAMREGGHWLIVSAGIGTSLLPLRLNAPPDIWVIDVEGRRR